MSLCPSLDIQGAECKLLKLVTSKVRRIDCMSMFRPFAKDENIRRPRKAERRVVAKDIQACDLFGHEEVLRVLYLLSRLCR